MSKNKTCPRGSGDRKTLVLIDSNALIHRGFHALPPTLRNREGKPTNAVYGFTAMLLNAIKELKPDYMIAAFDVDKKTFRHKEYKKYKAHRVKAPDELYEQIPLTEKVLKAFEIPIYKEQGFEADDIVGTLAKLGAQKNLNVLIVTGDLDILQLVDKNIKVFTLRRGFSDTVTYNIKGVKEKLNLRPDQVIDYKALRGDPSDNIPGVKGIGEKTAVDLLQEYETLETVLKEAKKPVSKISGKVKDKLVEDEESAILSQRLATIVIDMDLDLNLKESQFGSFDPYKVLEIFQELGFRSLIGKIPKLESQQKQQGTLFGDGENKNDNSVGGARERSLQFKYEIVDSNEKLDKLIKNLKKPDEFVIDLETTSVDAMQAKLVGVAIAFEEKKGFYIPVGHLMGKQLDKQKVFEKLKPFVESEKIGKIGHHLKYDNLVWRNNFPDSEFGKINFDTLIAAYLLDPDSRQIKLDDVVFLELGYHMQPISELIGDNKKNQLSFAQVPIKKAAFYAAEDAVFTFRLKKVLEKKLGNIKNDHQKSNLDSVNYKLKLAAEKVNQIENPQDIFNYIEVPLVNILAVLEKKGIELDPKILEKLSKDSGQKLIKLEQKIYDLAGGEFNVRSPKQLKEILFNKLKISTKGIKKTKTGFSTAASELDKLKEDNPIVKLITEHRELAKLKSTYLDALPVLINPKTKRLHTSFNQTIAGTGRLTSSEPNLQNIPVRTVLGEKIRKAFKVKTGYKLLAADYSQIELRVAALIAQEKAMLKNFQNHDDIHTKTAMKLFDVDDKEVTKNMRRQAKIVNFGILYGISAFGLSQQVDVNPGQAKELIDNYFKAFPKIKEYINSIKELAQKQGYVETIFGRRRYLPNINSRLPMLKNASFRVAINMPVQGSAADIIKLAMIELDYQLKKQKLKSKLILQVHDELLLEVPEKELNQTAKLVKQVMEGVVETRVKFEVDLKVGENWGTMTKLKI